MTAMEMTQERLDRALDEALQRHRGLYLTRGQVEHIAEIERRKQEDRASR